MKLKGKDINIMIDGRIVGVSTECAITTECELIEKSSPTSGTARHYIPGRTGWSVSINKFVKVVKDDLLLAGAVCQIKIGKMIDPENVSTDNVTGTAIVQNVNIGAARGSFAKGTLQLKGSGELS